MDLLTENVTLRLELERERRDLARVRSSHRVTLMLGKADAAAAMGLSERTLHRMIERGEVGTVRVGSRVLVPVQELERWVAAKLAQGTEGATLNG